MPTTVGRLDAVPVLVAHGDVDTVIPRDLLEPPGATCTTTAAPTSSASAGGHGISPAALATLNNWLAGVLAPDRNPS